MYLVACLLRGIKARLAPALAPAPCGTQVAGDVDRRQVRRLALLGVAEARRGQAVPPASEPCCGEMEVTRGGNSASKGSPLATSMNLREVGREQAVG